MGFEELATELQKGADAEGRKITNAAEKSAAKIVDEARGKAGEIIKVAKNEATEFAKQEASEKATSAKLAAKKMVDDARDEAVEASMKQVWQKFKSDSMKKAVYPGLLERLVKEGMEELGGANFHGNLPALERSSNSTSQAIVYARDEDHQYLQGFQFKKLPAEYCGGVIVESPNGKVRVNRTLEEVFAQKKPALRKDIYDRLF